MFDGFFGSLLSTLGAVPLASVPPDVAFWLNRLGIDMAVGGFVTGIVAAIGVIGARTAINIFTLGAARL